MNENINLNALLTALSQTANTSNAVKSKSKVKIVPDPDTGMKVRAYEGNPDLGYILVEESVIKSTSLTWKGRKRKTALIKGEVIVLGEWLTEFKGSVLPGRIVVLEYLEDAIPDLLRNEFFREEGDPDYDETYESYVKRAGEDGVELEHDGQRIFSFKVYDEYDEIEEVLIQHDNGDEVRQQNREKRKEKLIQAEAERRKAQKALEEQIKAEEESAEVKEEEGKLPK